MVSHVTTLLGGLGLTESTTVPSTQTLTPTNTFQAANTTTNSLGSLAQCAASWASYELLVGTPGVITSTSTYISTISAVVTDGDGDVYTTINDIPVASGVFTPTAVRKTTIYSTTSSEVHSRITVTPDVSTPSCSSLSPSDCSMLYNSYVQSLGLPPNASVPSITPAPTNSPACPDYYYKPYSSCSYYRENVQGCSVSGANVQLFYFPSQTSNGTNRAQNITASPVVQSYAPGITFTSPSIYLSFDYLSAVSGIAALESSCITCGSNGCASYAVGGGNGISYAGTSIAGALLTLAPEEVSTLIISYDTARATDVVKIIAQGLPGFGDIMTNVQYLESLEPRRLRLEAITHPELTDYYLRPGGAPGCNSSVPSPECSTMFEGMYRAQLSMPPMVSGLQGAWATCEPLLYGVYDPPIALTEVTTLAGPSVPVRITSLSTTTPTSANAQPATMPLAPTPQPTSVKSTQPSQDKTSALHSSDTVSTLQMTSDKSTVQSIASGGASQALSEVATTVPVGSLLNPFQPGSTDVPVTITTKAASQLPNPSTDSIEQQSSRKVTTSVPNSSQSTNALSILESALGDHAGSTAAAVPAVPTTASTLGGVVIANSGLGGKVTATTVEGQTFTVSYPVSGNAIVNGVTLPSEGSVDVDGVTIALPSITPASVQLAPIASSIRPAATTLSYASQLLTISYATTGTLAAIVNGATISEGASTVIVNGQTISLGSSGVLAIGSSTLTLSGDPDSTAAPERPAATTLEYASNVFTISSATGTAAAVVNGATISQGASNTVINGQTISLGSSGILVIGSKTVTLAGDSTQNFAKFASASQQTVIDPAYTQDPSDTRVFVESGTIRLTVGGSAQTVSSVVLSAGSGGVVESGSATDSRDPVATTDTKGAPSSLATPSQTAASTSDGICQRRVDMALVTLYGLLVSFVCLSI